MLSDESPSWIVACRSSLVFFFSRTSWRFRFVRVCAHVRDTCVHFFLFLHMPHVYKLFANDIRRLHTTTTTNTSTEYQHWILDDLILVFDWLFVRETHKTQTENLPICFGIWAYHRYFRICVLFFFPRLMTKFERTCWNAASTHVFIVIGEGFCWNCVTC